MRIFIRNILFFTSPLILGLIVFFVFILFVNSFTTEYKLNSNISEVYVGDSHIQCAIIDNLLRESKNLGQKSESFYFSYFKLKLLLASNSNIKKVYLGFSYHSLSNYYDQFISGKYSFSVSYNYFYILPLKEQIRLIYWNHDVLPTYVKSLIKKGRTNVNQENEITFSGGYVNRFTHTRASEFSMDKRLNFQYYTTGQLNEFSEINLLYFNKIINLCRINNIDLVLFNTPLHRYYRNKIPAEYISKYNEIIKNSGLSIIDFGNLSLDDNCFIPDGDHISEKGALKLTKELLRIMHEHTTKVICNNGSIGNSCTLP